MAVHLGNRPAESAPFVGKWLKLHRALGSIALLQAIAVDDEGEIVELIVPASLIFQMIVCSDVVFIQCGKRLVEGCARRILSITE